MRSRLAPVLLLLGCAAPARQNPAPSAPVSAQAPPDARPAEPRLLATNVPVELRLPASAPTQRRCSPAAPRGALAPRPAQYDFADVLLYPHREGPRIQERPRAFEAPTLAELRAAVEARASHLLQCASWARGAGPTLPASLQVELEVDPLGQSARPTIAATGGSSPRLLACAAEALSNLHLRPFSGHRARARFAVAFEAEGIPPSRTQPRFTLDPAVPPDSCVDVPEPAPSVELASDAPLLTVRAGRSPALRAPAVIALQSDAGALHRALVAQLGAVRACLADALEAPHPALGRSVYRVRFDAAGTAREANVASSTAPAPALDRCIEGALQQLTLDHSTLHPFTVNFAFVFQPAAPMPPLEERDTVERLEAFGEEALGRDASDSALRAYQALVSSGGEGERGCLWRLGLLRAYDARLPWPDARVDAAGAALFRFADAQRPAPLSQCRGAAASLLRPREAARAQP